ncbi:unnamed protein product [Symbiodinium sp. CCMP2592]|nr:unnamed protein product [Symbiodinium sp. CCMP2592]
MITGDTMCLKHREMMEEGLDGTAVYVCVKMYSRDLNLSQPPVKVASMAQIASVFPEIPLGVHAAVELSGVQIDTFTKLSDLADKYGMTEAAKALRGIVFVRRYDAFSVAVSIGTTVTMACHLLAYAAMKLDWLNSPTVLDHVKKDVAGRLMSCLCNWDMMDTCEKTFNFQFEFFNPTKQLSGNLKVSPTGNPEMLQRLQAKWNGKIQEYVDRQQPPPIHQSSICAGFRDSGRESQVYLMACVMVHFKDQMMKDMSPDEYHKMMSHWRLGHLDQKLFPDVAAMRPDFSLTDLGLRMQQEEASNSLAVLQSSDLVEDEAAQEAVRCLTNLARSLKREQDEMRGHRVAFQRHMVQTVAAEAEYQKSIAEGVESAWGEHSIYYQVNASKTLGVGQAFEHATHRSASSSAASGHAQASSHSSRSERVVASMKKSEEYQRAKLLLLNKDMQSTPPGDPPVTPRVYVSGVSKRTWERQWYVFKSRVRAYAEWVDLMT